MNRGFVIALVLCTTLGSPVAARAVDQSFTDTVCEKATPLGRSLNDLVSKTTTLTPELMAAALAMRDTYEDCVSGYDRDVTSNTGHGGEQYGSSNGAMVGRLYSRLALSRALQRVAQYDAYDKRFDDANAALAEANKRLDEMEVIAPLGQTHPGTPERTLVTRAQDVRASLVASAADLAKRRDAAASPTPKSNVSK